MTGAGPQREPPEATGLPQAEPADWRPARIAYHRTWLAFSIALVGLCVLLPPPGPAGNVRVPVLGVELPTICMIQREFGVDCAGCGMTRCFLAMAHGRPVRAWEYHAIGVVLFLLLVVQIPYRGYQWQRLRRGQAEWESPLLRILAWLLLAGLFVQWGLRLWGTFWG